MSIIGSLRAGPLLHVAVPVGAILFFIRRRRLMKSRGNVTAGGDAEAAA
ncbi:MAG: hypothetical protein U1E67_21055 [Hyphomicrobiales bacterium]